jgi:outer membrane lipoprotein-sorting protein
MKKLPFNISLISVFLLSTSLAIAADTPDVNEIVQKANLASYYAGDDGKSVVSMTITDGKKRERKREFVVLRKDVKNGEDQKFYVYFKKPSDLRKTVFLVHKHIKKDDDRWLYLPGLSLVKRIAASDKRSSFMGSHFFYEDVSGRSIHEDFHELIETTDKAFVLKNIPKDPGKVEFASYNLWIDKKTFIPMKAEYLNKQGKVYRLVEALEIKEIQGFPTVVQSRVKDLETGGETVSQFKKIQYNLGLKDQIFTERYLKRAPKEVR